MQASKHQSTAEIHSNACTRGGSTTSRAAAGPVRAADPAVGWTSTTWRGSFGSRRRWRTGPQQRPLARRRLAGQPGRSWTAVVSSCCHYSYFLGLGRHRRRGVGRSSRAGECVSDCCCWCPPLAGRRRAGYGGLRTTWFTFSSMARLASSMAWREPTSPISRSMSAPEACDTLILHPVVACMSFMVSPPGQS